MSNVTDVVTDGCSSPRLHIGGETVKWSYIHVDPHLELLFLAMWGEVVSSDSCSYSHACITTLGDFELSAAINMQLQIV